MPTLHLWEEHLTSFEVYRACGWRVVPVPDGSTLRWLHQGMDAVEIEAVMRVLRVPLARRPAVFRDVRTMAGAAAPILNGDD